jgi:hypothetical protein
MKQVYKFDDNGWYIEPVIIKDGDALPANCADKALPQPNWKPRFDKSQNVWIETITDEEKAALTNVTAPKSEIDILKEQNADLNLQVIEIWETLITGGIA